MTRTLRVLAFPLGLSLAAHVFLALGTWLLPGRPVLPRPSAAVDTEIRLRLAAPASPAGFAPRALAATLGPAFGVKLPAEGLPGEAEPSDPGEGNPLAEPTPPTGPRQPGLFEAPADARRVVYVLDASVSMALGDRFAFVREEVLASLRRLPPGARFQVIAYNHRAEPLPLGDPDQLLPARPETLAAAERLLRGVAPSGGTDHVAALRRGMQFRPDVLFFLTDVGDLSPGQVADLTVYNGRLNGGRCALHTREASHAEGPSPLRRLAEDNGGTYRCGPLR